MSHNALLVPDPLKSNFNEASRVTYFELNNFVQIIDKLDSFAHKMDQKTLLKCYKKISTPNLGRDGKKKNGHLNKLCDPNCISK